MSEKSPKGQIEGNGSSPSTTSQVTSIPHSSQGSSRHNSLTNAERELFYDGVEPFLNRLRDINFEHIDEDSNQMIDQQQRSPARVVAGSEATVSPSRFEVDQEEQYAHARMLAMNGDYGVHLDSSDGSVVGSSVNNTDVHTEYSPVKNSVDEVFKAQSPSLNRQGQQQQQQQQEQYYTSQYSTPDKSCIDNNAVTTPIGKYTMPAIVGQPLKQHVSPQGSPLTQILLPTVEEQLKEVRDRARQPVAAAVPTYMDVTSTPEYMQLKAQLQASNEQAHKYQDAVSECQEQKLQLSECKEKQSDLTFQMRLKDTVSDHSEKVKAELQDAVLHKKQQEQVISDLHQENGVLRGDAAALARRLRRKQERVSQQEAAATAAAVGASSKQTTVANDCSLGNPGNIQLQIPFLQTALVHNSMMHNCNTGSCGNCLVCTRVRASESERKLKKQKKAMKEQQASSSSVDHVRTLEQALHDRDMALQQQNEQLRGACSERDQLFVERSHIIAERDSYVTECNNLVSERDQLIIELSTKGVSSSNSSGRPSNVKISDNNNSTQTSASSSSLHGHVLRSFVVQTDYQANVHIPQPTTLHPVQLSLRQAIQHLDHDTTKLSVTSVAELSSDIVSGLIDHVNRIKDITDTAKQQHLALQREYQTQIEHLSKANMSQVQENTTCMSRLNQQTDSTRVLQRENASLQHQMQQLRAREDHSVRMVEKAQQDAMSKEFPSAQKTSVPLGHLEQRPQQIQFHDDLPPSSDDSSSSLDSSSTCAPHRYLGLYSSKAINRLPGHQPTMYRKHKLTPK